MFQEENLGCDNAVPEAITWFFKHEEMGIIVEDDVVLHDEFFKLCEEMLPYYKDEDRIFLISAFNGTPNLHKASRLGFTNGSFIWGWATWRRAWLKMDREVKAWESFPKWKLYSNYGLFNGFMLHKYYWGRNFKDPRHKATWDSCWKFSALANNGLGLRPYVNLSHNVGINKDGTHYSSKDIDTFAGVPFGGLQWPLKLPCKIALSKDMLMSDRWCFFKQRFYGVLNKVRRKFQ